MYIYKFQGCWETTGGFLRNSPFGHVLKLKRLKHTLRYSGHLTYQRKYMQSPIVEYYMYKAIMNNSSLVTNILLGLLERISLTLHPTYQVHVCFNIFVFLIQSYSSLIQSSKRCCFKMYTKTVQRFNGIFFVYRYFNTQFLQTIKKLIFSKKKSIQKKVVSRKQLIIHTVISSDSNNLVTICPCLRFFICLNTSQLSRKRICSQQLTRNYSLLGVFLLTYTRVKLIVYRVIETHVTNSMHARFDSIGASML